MRRYIMELFEGYYDAEYVNKRLRVGKVHKRIGVTPKLYVSAVQLLQTILSKHITQGMAPSGICAPCLGARGSLVKLILFDTQLVFDTYIGSLTSEIESAKKDVEDYAVALVHKSKTGGFRPRSLVRRSSWTPAFQEWSCG